MNFRKRAKHWWVPCLVFVKITLPTCHNLPAQETALSFVSICHNSEGLNICLKAKTAFDEREWLMANQSWAIMHWMLHFGTSKCSTLNIFQLGFPLEIGGVHQDSTISSWISEHLEDCREIQAEKRIGCSRHFNLELPIPSQVHNFGHVTPARVMTVLSHHLVYGQKEKSPWRSDVDLRLLAVTQPIIWRSLMQEKHSKGRQK